MFVDKVLLTALKDEVEAFKGDNKRTSITVLEDGADRLDNSFFSESFNLLGCSLGSGIRQTPDCLALKIHRRDRHEGDDLVNQTNVEALLNLL